MKPEKYRRILLRADGSASIGMGHVVRSLVLARELLDLGAEVRVWGSSVTTGKSLAESFRPVPVNERNNPSGGREDFDGLKAFEPDLVIVDGYHFSRKFFESLESANIDYGVIDDNGETHARKPRFVINQNPGSHRAIYDKRFPNSLLLLGLDYALVRREIRAAFKAAEVEPGSILISMGGADVLGLTLEISQCLSRMRVPLRVVLGPRALSQSKVLQESLHPHRVFVPQDFPLALGGSEFCVVAAGSTLWETNIGARKTLGIITADNQARPAQAAKNSGLIETALDFRPSKIRKDWCNQLLNATVALREANKPENLVNHFGALRAGQEILAIEPRSRHCQRVESKVARRNPGVE